ncbi:hypothetical protein [Nostoc sp.]
MTNELVNAGIPKNQIVLAFQHSIRDVNNDVYL